MSSQNLFSRNTVQTIIDSLDPRKKFLDLAKKNSAETVTIKDQNPFIEPNQKTPNTTTIIPAQRIEERINENFEPSQNSVDKPVNPPAPTCPEQPVERSHINVCVIVEIILLLLTFIACFYFAKKQIEMSKQICKQNKKIIKLLKTQMTLMVKP